LLVHSHAGPAGKVLLLPAKTNTPLIMVATGTGIAPFRSFWRRCFYEEVPGYKFNGLFWLFMGVANSDAKLYDDELSAIAAKHPENFRLDYALSREQNNRKGGKMYIQDKIEEYADEIFDLLSNNGGHMYFCGLKGMMPGITEMIERVCKEKNMDYEKFVETLKHENRWHVEVSAVLCCQAGGGRHASAYLEEGHQLKYKDRWLEMAHLGHQGTQSQHAHHAGHKTFPHGARHQPTLKMPCSHSFPCVSPDA
jgi:NAD(P)H-flavin reductase